ncbi:unnamed protein product, partial [Staurois parvus]
MCPLQHPRPFPLADASFCVPVPVKSGRTGDGGKFENFKKCHFFSKQIFHMLCPAPFLAFFSVLP